MKNLKNIINDLNLADENDEVFKEALELLLDFSNLKISVMKKRDSGKFNFWNFYRFKL